MTTDLLPSFFDLDKQSLANFLASNDQPKFRTDQVWSGMYQQLCASPDQFSNLPNSLRSLLFESFSFKNLTPIKELVSKDQQTQKILFRLKDGNAVETVLMRYEKRQTLCISTQVGCPVGCVFCATGQMGFRRNLSSGEIIEQVLYFARLLKKESLPVTNIVVMGMGEPFLNYDACLEAVDRLNDPTGLALGARRFTISTVGIIPQIESFAREMRQINLAISLHSIDDENRSRLIPVNKKYPVQDLLITCWNYTETTHRRITFEWALIEGVTDTPKEAESLAQRLKGRLCHVNLIQLNPTRKYSGCPTSEKAAISFKQILLDHGIACSIRLRRGIEIQAGCGQLASNVG